MARQRQKINVRTKALHQIAQTSPKNLKRIRYEGNRPAGPKLHRVVEPTLKKNYQKISTARVIFLL